MPKDLTQLIAEREGYEQAYREAYETYNALSRETREGIVGQNYLNKLRDYKANALAVQRDIDWMVEGRFKVQKKGKFSGIKRFLTLKKKGR